MRLVSPDQNLKDLTLSHYSHELLHFSILFLYFSPSISRNPSSSHSANKSTMGIVMMAALVVMADASASAAFRAKRRRDELQRYCYSYAPKSRDENLFTEISGIDLKSQRSRFLPGAIRRYHDRHLSRQHKKGNVQNNRICQLPTELPLRIADHLQKADVLCLAAFCQRMTLLTKRYSNRDALSPEGKNEFSQRITRDNFCSMLDVEVSKRSKKFDVLLCSACLGAHPKKFFIKSEASAYGQIRRCMGTTSTFRVCEHRSLNFSQLQEVIRGSSSSGSYVKLYDQNMNVNLLFLALSSRFYKHPDRRK